MRTIKNMTAALMIVLAGCLFLFAPLTAHAVAPDKTLTAGTGSGAWGATVSVPITIDDPAGVGGVAFTVTYDPGVFEFKGIEKAAKDVSDGHEYFDSGTSTYVVADNQKTTVSNTFFYQSNDDPQHGHVMIAAASAKELTATGLFNVKFQIKENSAGGEYPIGLVKTIIQNPSAGYTVPTLLPPVVGMPAAAATNGVYATPVYTAALVAGSITVNVASGSFYTISGTVKYEGGTNAADGTPVVLKKKVGTDYVFDEQTTTTGGAYSFADKPNGDYRVFAHSLDPHYFDNKADVTVDGGDKTANIVLPAPVRVSGSVWIGTNAGDGRYIPGLKVKVMNGTQVMGVFPVNPDGTFQSGPLPPGTSYSVYAVYGSLNSPKLTQGSANYWNPPLRSISGTVSGLPAGQTASIAAASANGLMLKTADSSAADGTYTIPDLVPADDYVVSAVAPGLPVLYFNGKTDIAEATAVDISAGNGTADFNYASVTKGTISGTVSGGTTGQPYDVFAFEMNTFSLTSVLSDANTGDYAFTLTPGDYEVFVIKDNGKVFYYADTGTTQNEANATILTITAEAGLTGKNIDITECDKTLTGKVTLERPDGDPVADALITAASADGRAMTVTAGDGTYTLTGLCDGKTYTVEMTPLSGNFAVQAATIVAGTDTTLNFIIDTGNELSGTVKDSVSGTGIPGAMIYLVDQQTGEIAGGRMYFSGPGGAYSVSDIPTGIYTLIASHPEYQTYEEENVVIDRDTAKDIPMVQGAHFSGTVMDGDNGNAPIPGALVIVTRSGGTPLYAVTDRNGHYAVYGLDDTLTYTIMAQKRGYVRTVLTNQTPSATPVDITLNRPAALFDLSGAISRQCDGNPVVDALVVVSSDAKHFFAATTTGQDGAYSFADLPQSNDYRFVVVPGGDLQVHVETGLNFTGDTTKDVTLPCGTTISGTVTWNGTGTAYVFLYTATNGFVDYTSVAASGGSYTFNGLTVGSKYKVLAVASGNTPEWYNGRGGIAAADLVDAGATDVIINMTD